MNALAGALVVALTLEAGIAAGQIPGDGRPNIIFIMSDDHAAHAIGAYGSKVNKTPHLDRLAREGALLDQRVRDELDLHAEPRRDSHRAVFTPERRDGVQPLRQHADDGREAAAGGRLSHRA